MRQRSIRTGNTVSHIELFTGTFGGPVIKDRLWFLTGARHGSSSFSPANYPNEVVLSNGDRLPSDTQDHVRDISLRLTAQIAQPLKFSGFFQRIYKQYAFTTGAGAALSQDPASAMFRDPSHGHEGLGNAKLTWTPTSRILVEGGYGHSVQAILNQAQRPFLQPERGTAAWYALARRTDTALNFSPLCTLPIGCLTWGGATLSQNELLSREVRAAVSYVTGSHNVKVGFGDRFGGLRQAPFPNADLSQSYTAGRPSSVTVQNSPTDLFQTIRYDAGLYVQDAWTIKRLTLSRGVRIQWYDSGAKASSVPGGRFAPARSYPELKVPGAWGPDVAPRFAVAYDLFGDGKTALKGNVSKYYQESGSYGARYSAAGAQTDTRNWFDCDLIAGTSTCSGRALPTNGDDIAQDNEIGPTSNPNFGVTAERTRDPNNRRPYMWEYTLAVQREVMPRLSVTGMYYRRTWGDVANTDRSLISRADYTAFQVPTPAVAQDPAVAAVVRAADLITVYNLNAAKRSVYGTSLVDTTAPLDKSIYTAVELGFAARFGAAGTVFGSWTMDRNVSVFCSNDDDPNGIATADLAASSTLSAGGRFCDHRQFDIPFLSTIKLAGNFPIRYGIQAGLVWQSYPGNERNITYSVPANLFPGGRTNAETILLNEPGSLYLPRSNQVDFNLRKVFKVGRHQLTGEFGLYNAFNSAVILCTIDTVGTSLGVVQTTLNGRTPRIGLQYKF
jgi:hypothetical protein